MLYPNMSQTGNADNNNPNDLLLSGGTNTLCSMATLDVGESCNSDEEDSQPRADHGLWGRLFPIGAHFKTVDLCKHEYTFGRGDGCDYSFNLPEHRCDSYFLAYSKIHFVITREHTTTGWHTFLEDKSSNGTFINGIKVGKDKRQVLSNNDEIALAIKKHKAFVYMDPSANDDLQFPEEIRERYTMSKVLGRGACGEVRLAFEKGTCKKFAIKVISKKTFSIGGKTQVNITSEVMNEVKVLKSLKHPCIIEVEDVIDTPDTLFIVLELVEGGELFERVKVHSRLKEPIAKLLFYQMVCAIKYLHDQGITHRDLKPENVLLAKDDEETLIKITDFGLSKFVDANTMMKTFCGTPHYLAPEVLLTAGMGSYTQAIDCWSLGVILFICLSGYPPFSDEYQDMSLAQQIVKGRYKFPKDFWDDISEEAKDMIRKLLTIEPQKRLTLAEALKHPWLHDEEMQETARRLMYVEESNGTAGHNFSRTHRPLLKRQREESNETLDGDVSNDSVDIQPRPKKIGDISYSKSSLDGT